MSAVVEIYRDDLDASYAVDFGRDREPTQKRSRFPEYRRKGSPPSRVNGMHCRRHKRWTWGSGRGARILNTRAFAGSLAFAVASLAATAFGVTLSTSIVDNPGNAAQPTTGFGAVSTAFRIGTYEVTNAQYAEFLNKVGQSNTNSIYNANMGSNANGGITQSLTAPFTYTVKAGFENKPVNFVSWYSAARFINWLQNGQTTNVASMENGAYTILNNATSGNVIARNAGAQVFLPTRDQAYKAAFYNPTGAGSYFNFATSSNSTPTNLGGGVISNFTTANSANYASSGPTNVGAFTNASVSPYGIFDMTGNVAELTETVNPASSTQVYGFGGAWNTPAGSTALGGTTATFVNMAGGAGVGFRVAAVPEPSTLGLAGVGFVALVGWQVVKQRRRKVAA